MDATTTEQKPTVEVVVVSDNICPWCFVGKRNMEQAFARFPHVSFKVFWKAFFLNPDIPEGGMTTTEYMQNQYGIKEVPASIRERLIKAGSKVGINFAPRVRIYPTLRSHRLVEYAKALDAKEGGNTTEKQNAVVEAIFKLYFEQEADISSVDVLVEAAGEVGLNKEEVRAYLESKRNEKEVMEEYKEAALMGIHGVPHFTISVPGNKKRVRLSGGQPPDAFMDALEELGIVEQ
ncbi:Thiol oxidoreductase FrnE [Balamuthia mandrillaris]